MPLPRILPFAKAKYANINFTQQFQWIRQIDCIHSACLWGVGSSRSPYLPLIKARWGRDGGLGGKDDGNAFSRFAAKRLGPPAQAATERRPAGPCPLRRRKLRASTATRGGPFPQNRQRMASTGPGRNGGDRAAHVKAKRTVRGGHGTATSASGSAIDTIISVRDPLSSEAFNIIKQESPIFTAGMFLVALHLPFSGRNEFPQFRFYDHR